MAKFIEWEEKYATGIPLIDKQHRYLFALTNELYAACAMSGESARETFIKAAHAAVNYVKIHFTAEEKILEAIHYPKRHEHKKQHGTFVKKVLESVKSFNALVATNVAYDFSRYLRDWILSHIIINDKEYAFYIDDLRARGALSAKINDALLLAPATDAGLDPEGQDPE